MERVFTRDAGKLFRRGNIRDFPLPTWDGISRSLRLPLNKFSKPVGEIAQRSFGGNEK